MNTQKTILLIALLAMLLTACTILDNGGDCREWSTPCGNPITDPDNPIQAIRTALPEYDPCKYTPDSATCKIWQQSH